MSYTIDEVARALGARAFGATQITVEGVAEPADAAPGDLALAMKPDYAEGLAQGRARAAVVWDGADWQALGLRAAIVVPRPRYAMSGVTRLMDPGPEIAPGIHQQRRLRQVVNPAGGTGGCYCGFDCHRVVLSLA